MSRAAQIAAGLRCSISARFFTMLLHARHVPPPKSISIARGRPTMLAMRLMRRKP